MKRGIVAGVALALVIALVGCGTPVSDDEAKDAFVYSYASVLLVSFGFAFGETIEGVSLDQESGELSFEDFDLVAYLDDSGALGETPYTSISGTARADGEGMDVDLTLEGGPVTSLSFSVNQAMMQQEDGFETTVTVNGNELELGITPEDLQ